MKAVAIVLTGLAVSLPAAAQTRVYEEQTNRPESSASRDEARQNARNAVTLKGEVDSEDTKRRAERVAHQVEGVAKVDYQLSVRTPG